MKRIYYIFFLATMLFSCQKPISDFQSANFMKFFGSGFESKGNDVIELTDGGYVVTGYDKVNGAYQIFISRVDENGNLVWSKTYGDPDSDEEGKIVKEVSDGILIAGTSLGNSGITHSFILKMGINTGDSIWYNEFGDSDYNIVVNDINVDGDNIYVAGQSDSTKVNKTEYYAAKLRLLPDTAELVWNIIRFPGEDCSFKRVFHKGESIILVGTYGFENRVSIATLRQTDGSTLSFDYTATMPGGSVSDVSMVGDQLFVLANIPGGTQLFKLNSGHTIEWPTDLISNISGKAVAYSEDGTLMIVGESTPEAGTSLINFIKVDESGNAVFGLQSFRNFQGTIGRLKPTNDKGLILVGTTNPTFGANVQLIKTDKDYFLLKP